MNTCVQSYVLSPAEQELGSKASDSLYFLHNPRTILLLANEVVWEMPFFKATTTTICKSRCCDLQLCMPQGNVEPPGHSQGC